MLAGASRRQLLSQPYRFIHTLHFPMDPSWDLRRIYEGGFQGIEAQSSMRGAIGNDKILSGVYACLVRISSRLGPRVYWPFRGRRCLTFPWPNVCCRNHVQQASKLQSLLHISYFGDLEIRNSVFDAHAVTEHVKPISFGNVNGLTSIMDDFSLALFRRSGAAGVAYNSANNV
jgi:hypothetical protein